MSEALRVEQVHKRFGGVRAVAGVDLRAETGELLGLFGPNGAGKTTLFNLISGAFVPDQGRIVLHGADITRLPAFQRAKAGIGRTFQVCRPFRSLSVAGNVRAALPPGAVAARDERDFILDILTSVGLAGRMDDLASTLTLGMLKRLEVARALALRPKLLLLDEPLAGLTAGETTELLTFIRTLTARATVILVDHNVRQSLGVCDRAVVLDAGAIIASGTPGDIRRDPAVKRAYLGEDAA